jgi:MYXO-CTERM domain-containing protein
VDALTKYLLPTLLGVLLAGPAFALTPPATGAAAKPPGLTLAAPLPCNVAYRIVGGYGDAMHKNINEALKANDYHALDFVRDEVENGHDKPVTAAAAGTVKYAGWASGGWSTYGQIVIIELDFNDGHSYQLNYAHLEKVLVSVGQHVNARDIIGHLGRSGENSLTYWAASHLHFVFYRDASIGSGGPYGGVAAVPEPLDGVEDFVTGTTATVTCAPPPPDGGPPPDGSLPPDGAIADGGADLPPAGEQIPPVLDLGGLPPIAPDPTPADEGGCGCAVGAVGRGRGVGLLVLVLLLALVVVRRRS